MVAIKYILTAIYFIICIALVILTTVQGKEDEGLSSVMTGSTISNFYEKNKYNTKEGKMKKWTMIFGVIFVILSVVLLVMYMA